ncbi:hypothetical protein BV20DRAFT_1051907 [Pilatotrama ljubarskyi]|nr:hypothetical protein BV20DRAFT_1051907 [Pilatotrama ljubarskyi]
MQRRTSQTFQRLRKLSDSITSAIAPLSRKPSESSFFEHGKRGWHGPESGRASAATSGYPSGYGSGLYAQSHRRPSYRDGQRVSKEDIRYPLLPPKDTLDPWEMNPAGEAEPSRRPAKARRPERPREEHLPYGAQGSIPKVLVRPYVAPPPAIGSSSRTRAAHGEANGNSVPFPQATGSREQLRAERAHREKPLPEPPKEAKGRREEKKAEARRALPEPARQAAFFNPFMAGPPRATAVPVPAPGLSSGARAADPFPPAGIERRPDAGRADGQSSSRQHTARVRRISSSGDVEPQLRQAARYRDENAPPRAHERRPPAELRPVKSAPLRGRENKVPAPAPPMPTPMPMSPITPLTAVKPRPRNVPRDVSPERDNPQRLPTPRRSTEELRAYPHSRARAPPASVAARVQAELRVQHAAVGARPVQVPASSEQLRATPYKAQVVRPSREHERERERERRAAHEREREAEAQRVRRQEEERAQERRQARHHHHHHHHHRPTHTRAVEVEYYGMSDAFAQEITVALNEPERAHPLPGDWRAYVATGPDFGVRPLVTKKSRQLAAGH